MNDLSWLLAVAGGPLIMLAFGYVRAAGLGRQPLQSLFVAAGAALAANVALDIVHTILFTASAGAFEDPFVSAEIGPVLVSPVYLMSLAVIAHVGWLMTPHGLREASRIVALPESNSLMPVAAAIVLAAVGFVATGRAEPPVVLTNYVFLSLFVFGFYWPMLNHALGEDGPRAGMPWRTITLIAAVGLNPLPDLWDALRSGGESLSRGIFAWLVSQSALLVLLGVVRARVKAVIAVFLVAFGGHLLAVVAAGAM